MDGNFSNFASQISPFVPFDMRNNFVLPCNLYTEFRAKLISNSSFYFFGIKFFWGYSLRKRNCIISS